MEIKKKKQPQCWMDPVTETFTSVKSSGNNKIKALRFHRRICAGFEFKERKSKPA